MRLRALLATPDGDRILRAQAEGPLHEAEALGRRVGEALLAQDGETLLAELREAAAGA